VISDLQAQYDKLNAMHDEIGVMEHINSPAFAEVWKRIAAKLEAMQDKALLDVSKVELAGSPTAHALANGQIEAARRIRDYPARYLETLKKEVSAQEKLIRASEASQRRDEEDKEK
jgi:hypothetical protein